MLFGHACRVQGLCNLVLLLYKLVPLRSVCTSLHCKAIVSAKVDASHPYLPVQRFVQVSLLASCWTLVLHPNGASVVG